MKIKVFCIYSLVLLLVYTKSNSLYASINSVFGLFSYITLKQKEFSPNYIFSNDNIFYAGIEYIDKNMYALVTPAIRVHTKNNFSVVYDNMNFTEKK